MTLKLVFIFALLCSVSPIYAGNGQKLPEYPNVRMCFGTKDPNAINFANSAASYKYAKTLYSDCTNIRGSVVLNNMAGNLDFSFLHSIVEIEGSLVIANNRDLSPISFPKLTIIRGVWPYIDTISETNTKKNVSLYISHNKKTNGKEGVISLGPLTSVLKYDISVTGNAGYCYLKTVDWKVFPETSSQKVITDFSSCGATPECSTWCRAINGHRSCYDSLSSTCQNVPNCDRSICEMDRCYRDYDRSGIDHCCREECAGGCLRRNNCFACKNVRIGKKCVARCPPQYRQVQNAGGYMLKPNPDATFQFEYLCVKQCPAKSLADGNGCVGKCSAGISYFTEDRTKCLPCISGCGVCYQSALEAALLKKKGKLLPSDLYDFRYESFSRTMRSVLKALINCTSYDGDIIINSISQRKIYSKEDKSVDLEEDIRPEDLDNLKNLEHMHGRLYLMLNTYPTIKDLKFLSKLKFLSCYNDKVGFFVMGNKNFEYLGLNSLKKIDVFEANVVHAPNLCYMENFKERFSNAAVRFLNLKDPKTCKAEGKVCDKKCSSKGCWGPGQSMCFE